MEHIENIENTLSAGDSPLVDSSLNIAPVLQNDVKIVNGDNKVDVSPFPQQGAIDKIGELSVDGFPSKENAIESDAKNAMHIQLCSCSIIFNCFTRNTMSKN